MRSVIRVGLPPSLTAVGRRGDTYPPAGSDRGTGDVRFGSDPRRCGLAEVLGAAAVAAAFNALSHLQRRPAVIYDCSRVQRTRYWRRGCGSLTQEVRHSWQAAVR